MRRFRVSSNEIECDRVHLRGSEFHHLRHVLRLAVGTSISLYDERGTTYQGDIIGFTPDHAEIVITQSTAPQQHSFHLTLAQSILKGHKMDLVVEKATELGVDVIVPIISTFTVARIPQAKQAERVSRWQRIAHAAAKQSGSLPPGILLPRSFSAVLQSMPEQSQKIVFSEHERSLHLRDFAQSVPDCEAVAILIGPEGGFAPDEVEQAEVAGFTSVSLGASVLRAETASLTAVALCQYLWRAREFPPLP